MHVSSGVKENVPIVSVSQISFEREVQCKLEFIFLFECSNFRLKSGNLYPSKYDVQLALF